MTKRSISIYQVFSMFVFIIFLVIEVISLGDISLSWLGNLQFISFIGLALIFFVAFSWKKIYYRFLSPYIIFILLLWVCLCGQIPFWAFNQPAGFRDLTSWMNLFTRLELCKGLIFSYLCLSFLHMFIMFSIDPITKKTRFKNKNLKNHIYTIESKEAYKKITSFGIILCICFIFPYLINFMNLRNIVKTVGYDMQYDTVSTGLSSILSKLSDFFTLGIITLVFVWGKKNDYNKNNYLLKKIILLIFSITYLACELLLGQRTGLILFVLALLTVVYKDRKIPFRNMIVLFCVGLVLMASMRMIGIMRSKTTSALPSENPVVDFISDTGWNLMSTVEFQKILPKVRNYGYGISYGVSFLELIPNIDIWTVHPAYAYGNISQYLRDYLGYSYGVGCTPVAEAYYNFGYFGFLVFVFWGILLKRLNRKFEGSQDFINNYEVVLFIGILLKSCVRSSFYAVFRPMILFVVLPTVILKLISSKIEIGSRVN